MVLNLATVSIVFTHKCLQLAGRRKITINRVSVPYSSSEKYLSIIFDSRLTFRKHVSAKCKEAGRLLMAAKSAIGKLWDPSLYTTRWMYEAIDRPMVTYCSVVWANRIPEGFAPLVLVQRLALLLLGHFLRITPTTGLETLFCVPALDLFAHREAMAIAAWIRGVSSEVWDGVGHGQ